MLFVGHDASRTGAPIVLLSLLRWAKEHADESFSVALVRGGPLTPDYEALATTTILDGPFSRAVHRVESGLRSVGLRVAVPPPRVAGPRGSRPDIVVANTLSSLADAARLVRRRRADPRLVCWVHELDGVADRVLPADPAARAGLLERVDAFIAVGDAVVEMLVGRTGVPEAKVTSVPEFIEAPDRSAIDVASGRRRLGLEPDRPTVLSVGALNRRKGPERFVDLMSVLSDAVPTPQGRWLGGGPGPMLDEVMAGVDATSGVSVRVVPTVSDPLSCAAAADVVVSTALEDPFPLAVLEAGALGVPVVGFDSGGIGQLMRSAGLSEMAVPVGDLLGLADVVRDLLADSDLRAEVGAKLRSAVLAHHLVDHLGPRVWEVILP